MQTTLEFITEQLSTLLERDFCIAYTTISGWENNIKKLAKIAQQTTNSILYDSIEGIEV